MWHTFLELDKIVYNFGRKKYAYFLSENNTVNIDIINLPLLASMSCLFLHTLAMLLIGKGRGPIVHERWDKSLWASYTRQSRLLHPYIYPCGLPLQPPGEKSQTERLRYTSLRSEYKDAEYHLALPISKRPVEPLVVVRVFIDNGWWGSCRWRQYDVVVFIGEYTLLRL